MSLISEPSTLKEFELPKPGAHPAEIVAVEDLGLKPTKFGERRRVLLKYRVKQLDSSSEPLTTIESFNLNHNKGSRLGDRISDLTGSYADPRQAYDLTKLVGWKGTIIIAHTESGGRKYANVSAIIRTGNNLHGLNITDEDLPI